MTATTAVELAEWERHAPEPGSPLWGMDLSRGRDVAEDLTRSGQIEILELVPGVEIRAFSWVGRVQVGKLTITVRPKLAGAPFLHLLRYAYGLRQLSVKDVAGYGTEQGTFQDLVARQLAWEAEELIARGLHRDYVHESAELSVPRGRIDFQRYVMAAGGGRASLPCVHHPRTRETILNRVLRSGLSLAARVTDDLELRGHLRRLSGALDLDAPPLGLDGDLLRRAFSATDRRTRAYEPSLNLIGLLMRGLGISLGERAETLRLPGFLFDMNRFFQALLARFLGEHLVGYTLRNEHRLNGMFAYTQSGNPRRRRAPTPRPDFVILSGNEIVSVLDAKYRDLWERSLPREMLYQLAMYALGHSGSDRRAVILYPTLEGGTVEQVIALNDPVHGTEQARIVLRPVDLLKLGELISASPGVSRERRCTALAERLAFGDSGVAI